MAISTLCPGCQTLLRLPDELAGKQVRCQQCSRLMMVPGVLSAPAKAAPKPPPRPEPVPSTALPPAPPPVAPKPPAPTSTPVLPVSDGMPAVVLVEVPVKPVPPPVAESGEAPPPRQSAPAESPRRPGPTMTLPRGERGRRSTNRPRRPTSVLAGLSLGGMLLLFVILVGTSFVAWIATEIHAQPRQGPFNNGNFVQVPPNQPIQPPGPVFPPKPFQPQQPPIFMQPQFDPQEPVSGAQGAVQTFSPGPRGPKFDDRLARQLDMQNKKIVLSDQLSNNDARDPVQRWRAGAPLLPCKAYLVQLEKGKHYTIEYQRVNFDLNFDPYLRVESLDGERLVEEDDVTPINFNNNHDMNSRIDLHPAKTAKYRIICTVFQKLLPHGGAWPFKLTIREQPIVMPAVNANIALPKPRSLKERFNVTPITEKGVQATALRREPLRPLGDIFWSADGRSFFVLYNNGLLLRCAIDGFAEERRLEIGRTPGSMAMSGQGLLVTLPENKEVWLIDPNTLQVRQRFGVPLRPAPAPATIATSPGLNFAYVAATVANSPNYPQTHGVAVLSLAAKGPTRFYDLPNTALAVSPDGSSLFAVSMAKNHDNLLRYELDRDTGDLELKETSLPYQHSAAQHRRIDISPDGKYVCVSGGVGAPASLKRAHAANIVVYPTADLRKPAFFLENEILVQAVGFDPVDADGVFTQARDVPFAIYDGAGHRTAGFRLKEIGTDQSPQQFLVHRDGGKVVIRFPDRLCYAVIAAAKAPPVVNRPHWPVPLPVNDGESLAAAEFKRGDVTYRELQLPNLGDIDPCWDVESRSLFHLETDGTLTRLSTPDFAPRDRLSLGQPASAMALSAQGLLVALRDQPEVWIINPRSLRVERAIACPGPAKYLATHPKQAIAVVVGAEVSLLDLQAGRVAARGLQPHPDAKLTFHSPTLTPDGQYLFLAHAGGGDSKVVRVRIGPKQLVIEDSRPTAVKGLHAFCVTADGEYVAWYTPNVAGKEPTAFYRVNDWNAPAFALADRARMIAPAGGNALYVQTTGFDLQYLSRPADKNVKTVPWLAGRVRIRQLAAQPNLPSAFVASTGTQIYYGERAVK